MIGASNIAVLLVIGVFALGGMFAYSQGWFGDAFAAVGSDTAGCNPEVTPNLLCGDIHTLEGICNL